MNREKNLIKNTGILAIGKICTQFISFFLLPLYTTYLTTKEYGLVDIINNFIALIIPIFFLQIEQAIFRFLIDVRDNNVEKNKIISTSLSIFFIQTFIFLICYLFISIFIKNDYKYFLLINVLTTAFAGLFLQVCRGLGDNKTYSIGSLISGISCIILNIILIAIFKLGAYGMLLATFLSNFICIIYIILKMNIISNFSIKKYSKQLHKEMLKYSLPLIPNQLSWWVVNASDRVIISNFISLSANGIYSAANKFSTICITFFNFFNMTWSESASLHIKDEDKDLFFSRIFNSSLRIFVCLCIIIICIMPFAFEFLIPSIEYSSAYYQIPILMLSTIFNIIVSLLGSIYIALKKSSEIAKTSILAALINILVNLFFIRIIGLYAASLSTLISYLAMSFYRFFDVQKYVKIKLEKKVIFVYLIMLFISIPFYYLKKLYLCFSVLLICSVLSLYINRKIIKNIFDFLYKYINLNMIFNFK